MGAEAPPAGPAGGLALPRGERLRLPTLTSLHGAPVAAAASSMAASSSSSSASSSSSLSARLSPRAPTRLAPARRSPRVPTARRGSDGAPGNSGTDDDDQDNDDDNNSDDEEGEEEEYDEDGASGRNSAPGGRLIAGLYGSYAPPPLRSPTATAAATAATTAATTSQSDAQATAAPALSDRRAAAAAAAERRAAEERARRLEASSMKALHRDANPRARVVGDACLTSGLSFVVLLALRVSRAYACAFEYACVGSGGGGGARSR